MSEPATEQTVTQDGVKTPAEIHADTLADPSTPAIEAEVLEETAPAPVKTLPVKLGNGVEVQVPVMTSWRASATTAMRTGDFDRWAELILSDADLDRWDDWMKADPEMGDINNFWNEVGKAVGEAAGMSRASRRQFERTQRR